MYCQNMFNDCNCGNKKGFNCPCEINCPWQQMRQKCSCKPNCSWNNNWSDCNRWNDNNCSPCQPKPHFPPKRPNSYEFCIEGKITIKDTCCNNNFFC